MNSKISVPLLAAFLALTLVLSGSAQTSYLFKLDATQAGVSSPANGVGIVELDATMTQMTCTIHHSVTGTTAAHIHQGAPGVGGGVVFPFSSSTSPITQTFTVGPTQVADLAAGLYYINVHSLANPGGEVRGQVVNAFPSKVFINEYCSDPYNSSAGGIDPNGDGAPATSSSQSNDEFVEIVNGTGATVNIGGWTVGDNANAMRHTFATGTMLPPAGAITVFGGGDVTAYNAAGSSGVLASTGSIGLNNTSDSIFLSDSGNNLMDSHAYVSGGPGDGDGESIATDPESPIGTFTKHTLLPGGLSHSAGFTTDGAIRYPGATMPAPATATYPGNGSDVEIQVRINGFVDNQVTGVHLAAGGDVISLQFDSPGGALSNAPFLAVAQVFSTGTPPVAISLPGDLQGTVYIDPTQAVVILADGLANAGGLLSPVLDYYQVVGLIPPALGGIGASVMCLCISSDPGINAVNLGVADSHALEIQ